MILADHFPPKSMSSATTSQATKIHEKENGAEFYSTPWRGVFVFSVKRPDGSLISWRCLRYMKGNRVVYPMGMSNMGTMGMLTYRTMEDSLTAAEKLLTFGGTACYSSYALTDKALSRLFKKHA